MSRPDALWYSRNSLAPLLLPFSGLFWLFSGARRVCYRVRLCHRLRLPVPVIVIGNITVGGTGKTPLVIWLARHLQRQGWRPGIVARGYGGKAHRWPQQVRADADVSVVGDEAVLVARRTGCPMCVGPDRAAAAHALLRHADCDVLISDDGLQHYRLGRDLEVAVIDGERRFGNGLLLPAGPLRETRKRLAKVDFIVCNGTPQAGEYAMRLRPGRLARVTDPRITVPVKALAGHRVHAVAGIGNPERFFVALEGQGLTIERHAFDDHHRFRAEDLAFSDDAPVLMTEKDAVKCRGFVDDRHWFLPVVAQPEGAFIQVLQQRLEALRSG